MMRFYLDPMLGQVPHEPRQLCNLRRSLAAMPVEEKAQDFLMRFRRYKIGNRANGFGVCAAKNSCRSQNPKLISPCLYGCRTGSTKRAFVSRQIDIRETIKIDLAVSPKSRIKCRPIEYIGLLARDALDLDLRPSFKLANAGVPRPCNRVPCALRIRPQAIRHQSGMVALKIGMSN